MAKAFRLGVVLCLGLIFTGCAQKWVRRPEVDGVRRIAVASVFANQDITGDRGSQATGSGLSKLNKIVGKEDADNDMRIRQVAYAERKFAEALKRLGWQVIPATQVAATPQYQKLAKADVGNRTLSSVLNFVGRVAQKDYVTLPKMQAIDLQENDSDTARRALKDLAEALKVDAVALIQVHLMFDESVLTIVGNRSVRPMAKARLDVFTRRGEFAVRTSPIQNAEAFEANDSVWIFDGKMKLDNKAENTFRQAIDKSIEHIVTRMQREMKET